MKDGTAIAPPPVPELKRVPEKSQARKRKARQADLRQTSGQAAIRAVEISPVNKTGSPSTMMRLMAGLDQPSAGRIFENSVDITGVDVRKHNVAMVYQQFINYPAATVFENMRVLS